METLINKFRELSRNTQIAIIISVCVFTPIVGMVFGIIGFILGFIKWSVAIPMLLIFAGYKAYSGYAPGSVGLWWSAFTAG
jgi:hypothetical protein